MISRTKHRLLWALAGLSLIAGSVLSAGANNDPRLTGPRSLRSYGGPRTVCPTSGDSLDLNQNNEPASTRPYQPALSRVPFIQNQGQIAEEQVLFYARTFGGSVYVRADGDLVYILPRGAGSPQSEIESRKLKIPRVAVLRETLVDADLMTPPSGAERSATIINSFIGSDPRRWQANIPSFNAVWFGEIYEGIALEVRATGNNVEKIFTVAPGADPARIALRLGGVESLSITPAGELEALTLLGPVRFSAPAAYQLNAAGERESVRVAYALEGEQVGFRVGSFDATRPLVIDPLLASTFIGGTSNNVIRAMALDQQTNVLVAGSTAATDFPTTFSYDFSYNGGLSDAFIAKLDARLTNLLAATFLGGAGEDVIMAMSVNSNNGAVYVAGYTSSTNFPTSSGAPFRTYRGGEYDAFVTVMGNNLNALTASTYLGGTNVDKAYALALGTETNVFVAGVTSSSNFPAANNIYGVSYRTNWPGSNDAFIARFNANLSTNLATTYLGGTNDDGAYGLALDTNGFVYVAGYATTNFPTTNGYDLSHNGQRDAFVAKLPVVLTNLVASTFLGATNHEEATGIAWAPVTNIVCVVGWTTSTNFPQNPTTNVIAPGYTNVYRGGRDAFLTRLSTGLNSIGASTYLGGTTNDEATAVFASASANELRIYVAGWTDSTNFPVTANAYDTTANGGRDAFVSLWNTGTALQASTYLGGGTDETAYALAFGSHAYAPVLFVAGATASSNFPVTLRTYDNDRTGETNVDGFVVKLGGGLDYGTKKWQVNFSGSEAASAALGWDGSVYLAYGANLHAFDAEGNQRWQVTATGSIVELGGANRGIGSPAVGTNGTIYLTTGTPGTPALQAISSSGSINWTRIIPTANPAFYSSPAIGSNGNIYFGTFSELYAVSPNGEMLWTNTTLGSMKTPAIASNGMILVANSALAPDGKLCSIYPNNGAISNTWYVSGPTYASPAVSTNSTNNAVYIGSGSNLYVFDPVINTTQHVWATAGQISAAPAIGSNGVIYIGGGTNFYAFNPDGTTNRVWPMWGTIKSTAAVDTNGNVLVGARWTDGNYYLFSLNPVSGATNWALELDDTIEYHSPLIRRDGTIYMSDRNNLYAVFGPAETAATNWPTAKHDVLRTGNVAFDAAPLLKPTGLTVTKGSYQDRVLVRWTGNPNADYYELFRSSTNDLATAQPLGGLLVTTNYVDQYSPEMQGIIYYYWVRVTTPVATSRFSDQDAGGVPPSPPTGVAGSKGNPTNAIVVTWNASSNATTYYLYHSLVNSTNTAALLATTTNLTETNSAPARGLTYYYWVKAGNAQAGISDFSSGNGVINSGGTPPLPPGTITATTNSYVAVTVAWSSSTGASMYAVYRNTNGVIPESILTNVSSLSFSNVVSAAFQNYYYWVRGTNQYGRGEFSSSATGFRHLAPPLTVHATDGAFTNKVRVSWQIESTEPTSYHVYRNTALDPATATWQIEIPYVDSTSTNYDDTDITRGMGYYYWLQSRNNYGSSVLSPAYDLGGTVPLAPLNVNASDGTSSSQISVTWNSASYATSYELYRADSYVPDSLTVPYATTAGTAYTDGGGSTGQRYYYWLKAGNQFGRSELSAFDTGWRPLASPQAVSASDGVSMSHLYVTWSASDNASSYELWRGTNSDLNIALMLNNAVSTNAYDDTEATQGVLFYYWLKAKNIQFSSDFSSPDSGYRALGEADLGVSDLVFLPTFVATSGAPSAVSFRLANYGVYDLAGVNSWIACDFFVSSNAVFGDEDDQGMGGITNSLPLVVGSNTVVKLSKGERETLAVPAVLPGSYYIFANIQHALPSTWMDPNQANNTAQRNGGLILVVTNQIHGLTMVLNDYNGDGLTDLATYQETAGAWAIWLSRDYSGIAATGLGGSSFRAVPADYDGDGKTDLAVYREATGTWEVWLSGSDYGMVTASGLGGAGFEPVAVDYDGDGLADPAVYHESTGTWMVWLSGAGYATVSASGLGGANFEPVAADYDGDGLADPAVYQESTGTWTAWLSGAGYAMAWGSGMGGTGYRPVAADYDRDGLTDPAVFQASSGTWRVWLSGSQYTNVSAQGMGSTGMVAVPGDYDGDGRTDPAVYWDSFGMWRLWLSAQGYQQTNLLAWPGAGYQPVWP